MVRPRRQVGTFEDEGAGERSLEGPESGKIPAAPGGHRYGVIIPARVCGMLVDKKHPGGFHGARPFFGAQALGLGVLAPLRGKSPWNP